MSVRYKYIINGDLDAPSVNGIGLLGQIPFVFLFLLCLLIPFTPANASILAQYSISNVGTGDTSLPPSLVASGLTASDITGTGGLAGYGLASAAFGAFTDASSTISDPQTGWPSSDFGSQALDIRITPSPGFAIQLSTLTYTFLAYGSDITIEVRTSRDNFATVLDGPYTIPDGQGGNEPIPLASFGEITAPVTFAWYAYAGTTTSNSTPIAGFTEADTSGIAVEFDGTVVAVPEPSALPLLATMLLLTCVAYRASSNYQKRLRCALAA